MLVKITTLVAWLLSDLHAHNSYIHAHINYWTYGLNYPQNSFCVTRCMCALKDLKYACTCVR